MLRNVLMAIAGLGLIGLLGFGAYRVLSPNSDMLVSSSDAKIDKDGYQAVFFPNDQVYFGKIRDLDSAYPVLEDVYYLVEGGPTPISNLSDLESLESEEGEGVGVAETLQEAEAQAGFTLVKLGRELHGPQDQLIINKDHILFIENLKEDGKLVEALYSSKDLEEGAEPTPAE